MVVDARVGYCALVMIMVLIVFLEKMIVDARCMVVSGNDRAWLAMIAVVVCWVPWWFTGDVVVHRYHSACALPSLPSPYLQLSL